MLNVESRIAVMNQIQTALKALTEEAQPFDLPELCQSFSEDDWAWILESLVSEQRILIWPYLKNVDTSAVLAAMREDARLQLVSSLPNKSVHKALANSDASQVIEVLDVLPTNVAKKFIKKLSPETQSQIRESLNYTDDQVGRYANHNVFTVNKAAKVETILIELKSVDLPEYTDSFLVIDENNIFIGEITVNELFSAEPNDLVADIAKTAVHIVDADLPLLDASNLLKSTKKSMLPVVTENGELLGRFDINDALEIFQEHYEAQIAHLGQVSDEDLFAPVALSARRRAVWLGINLLTAFMASFVIGVFDKVVAEVVALAVLMPIVASMGGITGSQTLTLTIRGLATGQLGINNVSSLKRKEIAVAAINGVAWSLLVAVITGYWFENIALSMIIAGALIVNMLVAALFGIVIPVTLDKKNIAPALAGSVILTTVTDIVGFFVFLGAASLILI